MNQQCNDTVRSAVDESIYPTTFFSPFQSSSRLSLSNSHSLVPYWDFYFASLSFSSLAVPRLTQAVRSRREVVAAEINLRHCSTMYRPILYREQEKLVISNYL